MFETLQQKIEQAIRKVRGLDTITESNIEEALREVRRALLEADVHFTVVKQFIEDVKKEAIGLKVRGKVHPEQFFIKLIYDEMVKLMGSEHAQLHLAPIPPTVILIAGLQGSGKTTFAAKLAQYLRKEKKLLPLLVAADIYRPAAIEQLQLLGQQAETPVFYQEGLSPVALAEEGVRFARKQGRNVVIIDTAGRLSIDEAMMQEVAAIKEAVSPQEILFVCDAMIGQDAVNTAKAFNERLDFTGVVLTKLDGDTRGGAALSVKAVVRKPIKFVSVGESLDALELFHPDRIASRILGMGDVLTLVEKAQREIDEEEARRLEEKLLKDEFTFEDLRKQLRIIKRMGPLRDLISLIPGMSSMLREVQIEDSALKRVEAIINSMTKEERQKPELLQNASRRRRIARGSGTTLEEVNQLIQQYQEMRKLMRQISKNQKRFGKRLVPPPGQMDPAAFVHGGAPAPRMKKKKKRNKLRGF